MNAEIDPNDRKALEAIAAAEGKDAEEVLRELVHEALEGRKRNGSPVEVADSASRRERLAAQGVLRLGSQNFSGSLDRPPVGNAPSGVLRELLRERAETR